MMDKKKIIELGEKIGLKKENIELGLKEKPKEIEKAIVDGAKFMGVK